MPRYPIYQPQPMTGKLTPIPKLPATDLFPSSGTAVAYGNRLLHGRHLAGLGAAEAAADTAAANATATQAIPAAAAASKEAVATTAMVPSKIVPDSTVAARGEMRRMEAEDDVDGNGIFDGHSRGKNVYKDAGVFASNWSIPGYISRGRMFAESEVVDATTGRPVVYVPAGAVSVDDAAKIAYIEGRSYIPLRSAFPTPTEMPSVNTANVAVKTNAVSGLESTGTRIAVGVGIAAAIGLGYYLFTRKG